MALYIRNNLGSVTGLQPFVSIPFLVRGLRIEHRESAVRTPIFLQLSPTTRPSRVIATMCHFQGLTRAQVDYASWKTLVPC